MKTSRGLAIVAVCVLAAGCSEDRTDLQSYVASIKARPSAPIEAIPQLAAYQPYTYRTDDRRAPFTPTTPKREQRVGGVTPDSDRAREPLESFPLDSLRMVGTIARAGTTFALVKAPDNVVHRVHRGNHMGQNYGEIKAVSNNGVVLSEIVPDGTGGYVNRPASIAPTR